MRSIIRLSTILATLASAGVDAHHEANQLAGTWSLVTANSTYTNGTTATLYGDHPVGILIFAPTLYFSQLLTVDPSTLPIFESSDRTEGTSAENAAAVAGTLGQIGQYNVSTDGAFESQKFIASTFPNWNGLYRNTSAINLTVTDQGKYLHETLHDPGTIVTSHILWERLT